MPDEYDAIAEQHGGRALSDDEVARIAARLGGNAVEAPDLEAGDRFVRGVASQLNPVEAVKGIAGIVSDPKGAFRGQLQAMDRQWEQAGTATSWPEKTARAVAGSVPLIGPAAADIGERIGGGEDQATALGEGVGLTLSAFLPVAAARGAGKARQIANKVRAPFAGELDPAVAAAAAREAGRGGAIDLPASAVSTSRPVATMEALAMKGFGGGDTAARFTTAANELTARANHLVSRASRHASESERGIALSNGFNSYRQAWIRTKNALYGEAERAMPDLAVPMRGTLDETLRVMADKRSAAKVGEVADPSFYQKLFRGLTEEVLWPDGKPTGTRRLRDVPVRDLNAFMKELNERLRPVYKGGDPFKQGDRGQLLRLKAVMQNELDNALAQASPDFAAKNAAAKAKYQDGIKLINSSFGKTIKKLAEAGKYDDIARSVANAQMSVDDIPRLLTVAGPEGTQAIRASVLSDIVARATKNGRLTPQGLRMAIEKFDRSAPGALDALLEPQQASTLRDLSTLSQSLEKGMKVAEGSQTAFLGRVAALGGALVSKPVTGLKLLLGDIGFNKFISSPAGQRWMKGGYRPWGPPMFTSDVPGAAVGSIALTPQATTGPAMQPAPAR